VKVSPTSSNLSHGGTIMSGGEIAERMEGISTKPYVRRHRETAGRPIRLSLVSWQAMAFLGATLATAACLLGECPCGEKVRPRAMLVEHVGAVMSVAFSPDGSLLATVGGDGSVVLREPSALRGYPLQQAGSGPVRCLAFSPDSKVVATGSRTTVVALHDLDRKEPRFLDDESAVTAGAAGLAFAPDGATLAVGQQDGRITIWDVATGRMRSVLSGHADFVAALSFAPDGATLASSGGDRTVRIWQPATGRERLAIRGQSNTVVALSFSPDGRSLALAGPVSPVVRLWDVSAGTERAALLGREGPVVAVAISPDGTTLAAAGLRGRITFWDLAALAIRPVRLNHAGTRSLAFAPDGLTLATGGFDGTIKLWDWPLDAGGG
jgi:dipeptidyl aminopeptidase/acylaminoacyl peptidase